MGKPTPAVSNDKAPLVVNVGDRVVRLAHDTFYARTVTRIMTAPGEIEVALPGGNHAVLEAGSYRIFSRVADKAQGQKPKP